MDLVYSKAKTRPVARAAAIFGAAAVALFALSALGLPGSANPVIWGTLADSGTVVLLDSGVQTSMWFPNPAGTDAILCVSGDAGTNAALGSVTLLGSNDGKNGLVLGTVQALVAPSGTMGWDPVNSGVAFYALQVDGGGTVAGAVTCTINNKGQQP